MVPESPAPSGFYHLYAVVEGLPRRWRPPATGVGGGPVVARAAAELTLIVTPLAAPIGRTPAALAAHDDVVVGLLECRAVVPLRFGTTLAAAQLATQVLREARLLRAPEPSLGFAQRVTARLQAEQQAIADFWHALEVFARRVSWTASVLLLVLGGYLWTLDLPTHQQVGPQETAEVQEIFPEPYQRPANPEEVLLSLTSNGAGR